MSSPLRSPVDLSRLVPDGAEVVPFERSEIEGSIGERFERIARTFPDRPAVREPGRVTTYRELSASVSRVARALTHGLEGRPGPIGLMLDAGAPLFAAMLGALEAGRFYVPLDPRLPYPRLEAIGGDLDAAAVITDEAGLDRARSLFGENVSVWCVEEIARAPAAPDLPVSVSPDNLAYVLFTSGSTGKPKGVMQSHRNVLHNVRKLVTGLSIRAEDRLTLLSSPSFGASVSDIFGALLTGASICPYALSGDGLRRLPDFLTREAITIYHSVPSVFRSFSSTLDGREDLSNLRIVKLGGEAVLASDFDLYRRRFPKSCLFHVGLGATEMNVIRQWFANHETPWPGSSPLGHAVDETEVVLLDEAGRETMEEGEIGVIASTLAVGYWKDPAQTAASFLPVTGRPGARLYRTGDRGRMLPDGCLLYLGRKTAGLKVRGHRVEPAEVEAALLSVPGVAEAVVEGRENREGIRLVAWLVRRSPDSPRIGDLRRALRERLPESMVPSSFFFLDTLPRTASGKVDRRALPEPGAARPALDSAFLEPRDEHEESAASVFAQVLGLDRVGVEDDFFELGGDSLSAVEALACLSDKLGAELSAADLLEASTPAALAARARRSGDARPDSLVRLQAGDRCPVFIVPGGGGDGEDLFAARRLARLTGGGFPFLCFRSGPAPQPPVEQLAARCVAQLRAVAPNGPYTLVGDCVGGILAFAMARRLREAGEDVALLALIDTPYPAAGQRLYASLLLRAPWADRLYRRLVYFRERLRYHRGVLRALPRGRMAYALRMARVGAGGFAPTVSAAAHEARDRRASYVGALLAWRPAPFDGTVRLVESAEGESRGFAAAWSRLASASEVVRVAGDHASLILEHGDAVAAALRRWLDSEPSAPSGSTVRNRSSARRGLARLSEAPRRALRRLLGRPPSDWMGPDTAPQAVRLAPRAEADNLHEVVSFEPAAADVHADELDGFLTKLAETGHRVFRIRFGMRGAGPPYELSERAPRLFEVLLRGPEIDAGGEGLDEGATGHRFEALDSLRRDLGLGATVSVVREPGWLPLVERMRSERAWAVVSPSDWAPLPVEGPEKRFAAFSQMLARAFPRISIVVVTYNNRDVNRVCLESLFARTEWPNTEVLVVDNASSDGTRELLVEAAGNHPNLRVIGLEENRGFPAAANAGLARATGAYLIVLNNDTVLTRGWATTLLRHLAEDPELGLVGPVTNAIANAARVEVGYDDIADLPDWAAEWTRAHDGETFPISMVAFFCVAMRREVFESVGPLDERFGLGLFEDKDYNRRVRASGWEIRCARDAFVHHWQMASFRRLGQEAYFRVFEENRKKYEDKWREEPRTDESESKPTIDLGN